MWPIAAPQRKLCLQVFVQESLLPNRLQQHIVHFLLVLRPRLANLLLLNLLTLTLLEESLLRPLLVRLAVPLEVVCPSSPFQNPVIDSVKRNRGLSCDYIARVHAAERHSIDFERSSYEKHALVQDLEKDYTFAPEAAGKQDKNRAWLEGGARFVGADGLAGLIAIIFG